MTEDQIFVIIQCTKCGHADKHEVTKYNKRTRKGLQNDYGVRVKPPITQSRKWDPHRCPECNQNCKSPNGYGTQKAKELIEIAD